MSHHRYSVYTPTTRDLLCFHGTKETRFISESSPPSRIRYQRSRELLQDVALMINSNKSFCLVKKRGETKPSWCSLYAQIPSQQATICSEWIVIIIKALHTNLSSACT